MDKSTSHDAESRGKKRGGALSVKIKEALRVRRECPELPIYDALTLILAFLFSRCHVIFGAHPLGLAFISVLPSRVWVSMIGAVLGSLTLGKSGIIYAMISVIVVFLRIIISGTGDKDGGITSVFGEGLILRMSSAIIGGFIAAVYEVLLSGFTLTSVAFGVSMIILPPLIVFAFSGVFEDGLGLKELFFGDKRLLYIRGRAERDRYNVIFFIASALMLLFFVSLSLKEYSFIGISPAYIFAPLITVTVARRFGSLYGAAVGFASALCLSSQYAAAYALIGLVSGFLFSIGLVYALVGGGIALGVWCAYAGGVGGILSTLPEYMLSSLVAIPILKHLAPEKTEEETVSAEREAADMVGTVALSYKNKYTGALDSLSVSLTSLSLVVKRHGDTPASVEREELRALCRECSSRYIFERDPSARGLALPDEIIEKMTALLVKKERVTTSVFDGYESFEHLKEGICDTVNRAAGILAEDRFREERGGGYSEYLELIGKLIAEARMVDEREKTVNESMSTQIAPALDAAGLSGAVAKVFGERRPHFIIAAEDERGTRITSPLLKSDIEARCGVVLGTPEFFRRGRMALMEVSSERKFSIEAAYAARARTGESVSGDTVRIFESEGGIFRALISDGVGSGEEARRASELVGDFLGSAVGAEGETHTALRLLNHIIRRKGEGAVATVDLFSFDMFTGEGYFMKSGAACSYIKRDSSIFRIRSHSAPLGAMKRAECERIRADVRAGDVVVLLSDGITACAEDSAWLIELLARDAADSMEGLANSILKEAEKRFTVSDDMTAVLVRILGRKADG